ncbi:MAG: HAMP domain-containing histidine kinase [Tannerella sp.]|jgi:signal transduction histidine kinase|nr:HAMP domain-containing histidine kinase [Tannerella sp.]
MKLIYRIIIRLFVVLSAVLALWAVFFYFAIIDEINDEVDDSLEDYSEQVIIRFLAGEELPSRSSSSNNQYYLSEVTPENARSKPHVSYIDSMVYIPMKRETEPARILTTIYRDEDGKYYELVVSTPTIEKKDLKEAILFRIVFLYVGILFVIIAINVRIYHRSNRPLYKLLAWLDKYNVGENNTPLQNDTDITEFKKLNEAAMRNMKRAEEVFEEQKQFIGNASHEMQTPLAVCRNRLETLMEDETLTKNQLEELSKTYSTLGYITKLNKMLLLLYKIDNRQFTDQQYLELNEMIRRYIEDYKEVYASMDIYTEIKETGIFRVRINETLAGILVNNILKNGYVHNIEHGRIAIEISSSKFIVKNTGQPFPLHSRLIFERFYQGSKKDGSTGLGLALVKSICEMENLVVKYYFKDDFHCFEISRFI